MAVTVISVVPASEPVVALIDKLTGNLTICLPKSVRGSAAADVAEVQLLEELMADSHSDFVPPAGSELNVKTPPLVNVRRENALLLANEAT
ncbi:hypothetical protein [Limnothrix redekei]|uniref:Uncharacterized protein n=1 Tax=Limnothrix redekei LRLZ20PSL1 TaxID=3112953 RepID=A0ABW7CDW4_9CYAN